MGKNYYPRVFLEHCKYAIKQNNMSKFIKKELEICFNESDNCNDCDDYNESDNCDDCDDYNDPDKG